MLVFFGILAILARASSEAVIEFPNTDSDHEIRESKTVLDILTKTPNENTSSTGPEPDKAAVVEEPPLEFPVNDSMKKIVETKVLLKSVGESEVNGTDTEVGDLLHGGTLQEPAVKFEENSTQLNEISQETLKDETEPIQTGPNEDTRPIEASSKEDKSRSGYSGGFMDSQLAGIAAAIFLVVAILGYIALVSWRSYLFAMNKSELKNDYELMNYTDLLEKRYGARELLVNEEDMGDPNDMRNFSI